MVSSIMEAKDEDLGLFGRVLIVYMRQKGDHIIEITDADIKTLINLPHEEQPVLTYVERPNGLSIRLMSRKGSEEFAKEFNKEVLPGAYHKSKKKKKKSQK